MYFDKAVQITITPANEVVVKGAKHSLTVRMRPEIKAKIEDGKVILSKTNEATETRAYHGLYRALIQNAVTGVSKGWTRDLELNGVGYRAAVNGSKLEMSFGLQSSGGFYDSARNHHHRREADAHFGGRSEPRAGWSGGGEDSWLPSARALLG